MSTLVASRPRIPARFRLSLVLVALLAVILAPALGAAAAHAVDTGSFGIRPAHESTFFHLNAYPGETIHNTAIVSNHTARSVTLLDYPVDARNSATGTFAMASQTDPRTSVGAWVRLPTDSITVPAGADRPLDFRLTVPAGTAPGDYVGALIIQAPPVIGKTAVHDGTAVRLNIVQRQGLRIYLHVQGAAVRGLQVASLVWTNSGDGVDFTLPIHNTGNTILHPTAELSVTSSLGTNARLRFTRVESILPGDELTLHAHLAHPAVVQIGRGSATVRSEAGSRTVTADYIDLPWSAAILILAVLLLAATIVTASRRRRHRRARERTQLHPLSDRSAARARHRAQPAR